MRMPSYDTLKRVFEDEEEAISFLYQHSAVYKERNCPNCERKMILNMEKRTYSDSQNWTNVCNLCLCRSISWQPH